MFRFGGIELSRYVRLALVAAAGAALAFAVAGCGGDGGSDSSGTTQAGGINEDPAKQLLSTVGLEVCSEKQLSSTAIVQPGFAGARIFQTKPDCGKAGPTTTIVAATFTSHEAVAAGATAIKKKYPKAAVETYKTLVIGVLGPNAQKIASTIHKQVSSGATSQ